MSTNSAEIRVRTPREAVAFLNARGFKVTRSGIHRLLHRGELPMLRLGGRLYLPDLEGWLEARAKQSQPASRPPATDARVSDCAGADERIALLLPTAPRLGVVRRAKEAR